MHIYTRRYNKLDAVALPEEQPVRALDSSGNFTVPTGVTKIRAEIVGGGGTTTFNGMTASGGWAVTPSGTTLYFAYNGTNKAKLDSSGNLTCVGNVTAYGTV